MASAVLVSVEGNIGAGKSTLLKRIEALGLPDVVVVQEPVGVWCEPVLPGGKSMLEAYYNDRKSNALAFQMYAMLTRHRQHAVVADALRSRRGGVGATLVITERCAGSDFALFGRPMRRAGLFNDAEWHSYESWHDALALISRSQGYLAPSGVAYLRVEPDVCEARVASRARHAEGGGGEGENGRGVDRAYLDLLHDAHEAYVDASSLEVLRVAGNDLEDAERVVEWARRIQQRQASQDAIPE